MADEGRADSELADVYLVARNLVELETGKLRQVHREKGRGEIALEARLQPHGGAPGPPDVDLDIGPVERREEAEALDVVHVQVREQDVDALQLRRDGGREPPDAGSGIQDQDRAPVADHAHAQCCRRGAPPLGVGRQAEPRVPGSRAPHTSRKYLGAEELRRLADQREGGHVHVPPLRTRSASDGAREGTLSAIIIGRSSGGIA